MTILSVCQQIAPVIGLAVPSAVMASTTREHVELAALANEMAARIAGMYEWEALLSLATYTGDGSTEAFSLPSDYDRMPVKAQLWSSSLETPLTHITSSDEWLGLDVQSFDFVINAWIKLGGQILIKPALGTGVTAKHYYLSNLIVSPDGGGANKTEFTADTDSFRLDERLLRLGIIWQWRAYKGLPYAEHLANFEEAKERLITRDKGSRMVRVGGIRLPKGLKTAYPQSITP